nr:uncharacterized protein LOC123756267 [Procambarus clarkii]
MMTTETGATADPVRLGGSASSIMNKVQEIIGEVPQKQLSVEDLRRMREPVKRLVEAGRVLAVQEDQYGRRFARITLQEGQLFLHPLMRQPTPSHAHTLQRVITLTTHVFGSPMHTPQTIKPRHGKSITTWSSAEHTRIS